MRPRTHRVHSPVLLLLLLASTAAAAPPELTVSQLLTRPRQFNGRRVAVTGYYYADFETSCVSSSVAAAKHPDLATSVWVEFHGAPDLTRMAGRHVRFVGTFHLTSQAKTKEMRGYGSYGIWEAALLDTTSFTALR